MPADALPAAQATQSSGLRGSTALVTGAGRGIGRAVALTLAAAGADVVLLARTAAELDQVRDEIVEQGGSATTVGCDLTDVGSVERALSGHAPQILVNGAGINVPGPLIDAGDAALDRILDLNVRATLHVTRAVARTMVEAGRGGVIITITSQLGHVGAAGRVAYSMSKHAQEGMTRALAVELAPDGIRVVSVAPTFVDTDMTHAWMADDDFSQWVHDGIPLGRLATTHDVACAVRFLAGPEASMVTGSSLLVDGGWTAR